MNYDEYLMKFFINDDDSVNLFVLAVILTAAKRNELGGGGVYRLCATVTVSLPHLTCLDLQVSDLFYFFGEEVTDVVVLILSLLFSFRQQRNSTGDDKVTSQTIEECCNVLQFHHSLLQFRYDEVFFLFYFDKKEQNLIIIKIWL